jgi:signal transduction histidine kinase
MDPLTFVTSTIFYKVGAGTARDMPGPPLAPLDARLCQILSGGSLRGLEGTIRCRDGTTRQVVWNAQHLDDYDGAPAILGVGHDITGLKQAQERALQAERLAAIGQMVAGLAHESRNALQRSQACLEMLALELEDRPEGLELLGRIQRAQDHLHHLYEEVRGYAAPIRIRRQVCDLDALLRDTWSHLEVTRRGRDVRLAVAQASRLCGQAGRPSDDIADLACSVDRHALEQVFRNVLENAISVSPDPGEIAVCFAETRLDGRPALEITVRDQGPGLSPEQQERIFEPFFTTKTHGTGLGMAIAKRIVDAHGGRISVRSAVLQQPQRKAGRDRPHDPHDRRGAGGRGAGRVKPGPAASHKGLFHLLVPLRTGGQFAALDRHVFLQNPVVHLGPVHRNLRRGRDPDLHAASGGLDDRDDHASPDDDLFSRFAAEHEHGLPPCGPDRPERLSRAGPSGWVGLVAAADASSMKPHRCDNAPATPESSEPMLTSAVVRAATVTADRPPR